MINPTPYPVYPFFAFLSFVLVLIPLPWHLQAWNSGTCLFMIWTALGCLNFFINSIIWHGNTIDLAPVWCDISTRLTVAISVAIPAASLCINRRLYKIASCTTALPTAAQKRRAVLIDLLIGLGIPALQMPLQFIVQGHRYDILEDIGCYPTTVNTPPAYPLSFLWPNVIGLLSAFYSLLTLRAFLKHRAEFSKILSSNGALSANRYLRLMLLATLEIIINVPISSYGLYLNATKSPIYPWKGWSDIHYDWYTIGTYPAVLWRFNATIVVTLELTRWSPVICATVFFAFFGFAQEARRNYHVSLSRISNRLMEIISCCRRAQNPRQDSSIMKQAGLLPVIAPRSPVDATITHSPTSPYGETETLTVQSPAYYIKSPTWKTVTPISSPSVSSLSTVYNA